MMELLSKPYCQWTLIDTFKFWLIPLAIIALWGAWRKP